MVDWPLPHIASELCGFLGLTGFYRHFICQYAAITRPLTTLLCKDQFYWSDEATHSFLHLKEAMIQAPVLVLPDFSLPFVLETDASATAMGAILQQRSHPIAFYSKVFCPRLQHASTYIRELHAITSAVRKWRHYLLGYPFIIITDHKSLKDLMSQVLQTPEQQHYLSKLLRFDYSIQYRPGSKNVAADALSWVPVSGTTHFSLSMVNFEILEQLRLSLQDNHDFQELSSRITVDPDGHADFAVCRGLIFHKQKIWLPPAHPFIHLLLEEFHSTPVGGHLAFAKTLRRLQDNFTWPTMHSDVRHFVSTCLTC